MKKRSIFDRWDEITPLERWVVTIAVYALWYKKQVRAKIGNNFSFWRVVHAILVAMLIRVMVHAASGCGPEIVLAKMAHPMIVFEGLALCMLMPRSTNHNPPPVRLSDNGGGDLGFG